MNLDSLMRYASTYRLSHPGIRQGQADFNAVAERLPAFAERIAGTSEDPFHDDDNLGRFWLAVAREVTDE